MDVGTAASSQWVDVSVVSASAEVDWGCSSIGSECILGSLLDDETSISTWSRAACVSALAPKSSSSRLSSSPSLSESRTSVLMGCVG